MVFFLKADIDVMLSVVPTFPCKGRYSFPFEDSMNSLGYFELSLGKEDFALLCEIVDDPLYFFFISLPWEIRATSSKEKRESSLFFFLFVIKKIFYPLFLFSEKETSTPFFVPLFLLLVRRYLL